MKLLIILDRDAKLSPERVAVFSSKSTISIMTYLLDGVRLPKRDEVYHKWKDNKFKTKVVTSKFEADIYKTLFDYEVITRIKQKGKIVGYAVLCENDESFGTKKYKHKCPHSKDIEVDTVSTDVGTINDDDVVEHIIKNYTRCSLSNKKEHFEYILERLKDKGYSVTYVGNTGVTLEKE